ncbi:MAG: hypothetical protein RJA52_1193 [Bacteroidota bacterium]
MEAKSIHVIPSDVDMVMTFRVTHHATVRFSQRNISEEDLELFMEYAHYDQKQGLEYLYVSNNCLPDKMKESKKKRVKNLVLVLAEGNSIVTGYRSKNPVKHLKKKSKKYLTAA